MPTSDERLAERVEQARQVIFATAREPGHHWRMSIPVDTERDSDCILIDVCDALVAERRYVHQLETQGKETR